mmetsp:Transcript_5158/g.12807  ORF Transcript_5158/g.12807 Transcript_5158/m.12807 type:complete len:220 (-) Transcript_5158:3-662(-)
MMSDHVHPAMGFSVRLLSSHTLSSMRCAAWSMRRPVMRMSLSASLRARWNGSTLLTKSKSAESRDSQSPYLASNSSRVVTSLGYLIIACLPYFSCTSRAHASVSGKRCKVSIATRCMPLRTSGKCFRISATNTLSVASQAVAKTTRLPSVGRCFAMSALKASTFPAYVEKAATERHAIAILGACRAADAMRVAIAAMAVVPQRDNRGQGEQEKTRAKMA